MPTVLIVDDVLADRMLAEGLLKKQLNVDVAQANDGESALAYMAENSVDVVVTDLQMPGMNGLELVEESRKRFPKIPIIVITGEGSEEIATQALARGAASYVAKKHMSTDLQGTVQRLIDAVSQQRNQSRLIACLRSMQFVLENDLELITSQVRYLRETVEALNIFDETDCMRIGTALDEAILNAYYHGNLEVSSELREKDHNEFHDLARQRSVVEPYSARRIHIEAEFSEEEVSFTIRDDGPGFDPSQLPDPTSPEFLERPSGRGLLLMRAFMDDVEYNEAGNQVTLRKRPSTDKN